MGFAIGMTFFRQALWYASWQGRRNRYSFTPRRADSCLEKLFLQRDCAPMWCSHCHQDVPAISSETRKSIVCAKCHRELRFTVASAIVDAGIALDEQAQEMPRGPIGRDLIAEEESRLKLRQLGRQIRAPYAQPISIEAVPFWDRVKLDAADSSPQLRTIAKESRRADRRSAGNGFLTFLLTSGVLGFFAGATTLIWSAAYSRTLVWQWGLTATLASEGLLIVGLTWMAVRLWHNSRRLNHELRHVDDQLEEIHELAGSISAGRLSGSQHYYHHFSQVANPHMLVANLRGQIDQLAERMAG
jgi:hypothetical protein